MKALIIDRYGSGTRVRAGEVPDPMMHEDDVLAQIHAAGVNLLDSKIRNGECTLILPCRMPLTLGQIQVHRRTVGFEGAFCIVRLGPLANR